MNRAVLAGVAAVMCSLSLPMLAEAQTVRMMLDGVSISGTVIGKSGAGLPNATVIAKNRDTGFVTTVNSNSSGKFSLTDLPDGFYSVSALAPGFDEPRIQEKQNGITVSAPSKTIFMNSRLRSVRERFSSAAEITRPDPNRQSVPDRSIPDKGPRGPIVITPHGSYL